MIEAKTRWDHRLRRWLVLLIAGYLLILVLLMLLESKLVYPAPRGGSAIAADFRAEDVRFTSQDGTSLHGWYFERDGATLTLVFFHGNAESVETSGAWIGGFAATLNANVFIFDYRGYGKSDGTPFEKGVVQDGMAAVQWLSQRTGKSSDQFVYLGRSLGGGVAIQVAREKPPQALVLVSTFSSIVDVASNAYWWLPIRWLMQNRYESAKEVADVSVPLMQIHGDRDRIIPIKLGQKLHAASPAGKKKFVVAEGLGHNNLPLEKFRSNILEFLR